MKVQESLINQIIEAQDFEPKPEPALETYEDYIGRTFVNIAKKDAKAIYREKHDGSERILEESESTKNCERQSK